MKNLFFALLSLSVILFASCSKEETETKPSELPVVDQDAPIITQGDMISASWDELPSELRTATKLEPADLKGYYVPSELWGSAAGTHFSEIRPYGSTFYAIAVRAGSVIDGFAVWFKRTDGSFAYYQYGGNGGVYDVYKAKPGEIIKAVFRNEENFYGNLCIGGFGVYIKTTSIWTPYKKVIWGDGENVSNGYRRGWEFAKGEVVGFTGYYGSYINGLAFFDGREW